jgi:hypothetical protein
MARQGAERCGQYGGFIEAGNLNYKLHRITASRIRSEHRRHSARERSR